ncbi:MAG TPA: tRNA pseudouridine(38-40) synthase TruA [Nitrospirota bacterium]|nr:tRNA pseudouridine(38-40) synthase TruA [Nitrospirota bacterium]
MKRNIKIILEYDGTNYFGWQSQSGSGRATIQETLEQALKELTGEDVKTYSSGRTDAGVHALGHVAHFRTESRIPSEAWAPALNHLLPEDIRVQSSEDVPDDFHARYSATGKIYRYVILNRRAPSALHRSRAWLIDRKLNLNAMRRAAGVLIGTHNFSAFRSSACNAKTPVRKLSALTVIKRGDFVEILLEADAFLMHMARNIVGTLVDIGLGRYTADAVKQMLLSRDRSKAGRTAPACGLYLVKVLYREK